MAERNEPGCCISSLPDSFTTVLSNGEGVEDLGKDASEISSRTSAELESILSRLKAADHSGLWVCVVREYSG